MISRLLRKAAGRIRSFVRPQATPAQRSRWDDAEFTATLAQVNWMASPAVLAYLNERATGHPLSDWITGWGAQFCIGSNLNVLVLGCGEGWLERSIAAHPAVAHIHAVDVAAEAVERARASAAGIDKISYGVVDLNRDVLAADAYDVVFAHSVLHHVENLEHAFEQIRRAMRRDATLLVNEYVGPKRFQFSPTVLDTMNRLLATLPARLRKGAIEKRVYEEREIPPVELMIQLDPTEAVRSDEIVRFLHEQFNVLSEIQVGGTLLMHMLYDIVQNFRIDDPRERAMLELLCTLDGAMVDYGAIGADFALLAATRRDCTHPREAYGWSRHPMNWRDEVDRDPLLIEGFRARATQRGKSAERLPDWLLRVLRIALVSTQTTRGTLITHDAEAERAEQARYAAQSEAGPFDWVIGRYSGAADLQNEDARAILRLLETMEQLAIEHSLVP